MAAHMPCTILDDDTMDSWYRATKDDGLNDPCADFGRLYDSNGMKHRSNEDASNWFYQVTNTDNIEYASTEEARPLSVRDMHQTDLSLPFVPSSGHHLCLNKPLPAIPTPYFEYMFADAGREVSLVQQTYSPDNLSFEREDGDTAMFTDDAGSPADTGPQTPPASQPTANTINTTDLAHFAFSQAGVDVTTKEIVENQVAAVGTGLAGGNMSINEADESEKENATIDFYGGVQVEESPSPFHAPIIGEDSGFGDIRDGAEAFPEQWSAIELEASAYVVTSSTSKELRSVQGTNTTKHPNPQPENTEFRAPGTEFETATRVVSGTGLVPVTTTKGTKRPAQDADFLANSVLPASDDDDDEVRYLYTKKVRLTPHDDDDPSTPSAVAVAQVASATSRLGAKSGDHRSTRNSSSSGKSSRKADTLEPGICGFAGQFKGFVIDHPTPNESKRNTNSSLTTLTFGDRLHPNYLFTKHHFTPDPLYHTTEFTTTNLPNHSATTHAIAYASDLTENAASLHVSARRSQSQENLRREAHLECTSARLEGVSVGQYRYYQGHLNLEEYKQCRMCICWDLCSCSKLCTRFGDLICPCSDDIVIHKD